jgi:putative hydrolase of the HAD superfamily
MKKYRHLLFDLDHTLWDFEKNSKDTLEELFNEYNLNEYFRDTDEFIVIYNRINHRLWDEYRKGLIGKEDVKYSRFSRTLEIKGVKNNETARGMAEEYVKRSPCKTALVEGAAELIQALFGKYRMHIITNGFNEVQFKKVRLSGLAPYFDNIFTSENAGYQKPDTGFFNYVFGINSLEPSESIVIGDNIQTDIIGAKNFGLDTIFYNPEGENDMAGATHVVSHLSEIQNIL